MNTISRLFDKFSLARNWPYAPEYVHGKWFLNERSGTAYLPYMQMRENADGMQYDTHVLTIPTRGLYPKGNFSDDNMFSRLLHDLVHVEAAHASVQGVKNAVREIEHMNALFDEKEGFRAYDSEGQDHLYANTDTPNPLALTIMGDKSARVGTAEMISGADNISILPTRISELIAKHRREILERDRMNFRAEKNTLDA